VGAAGGFEPGFPCIATAPPFPFVAAVALGAAAAALSVGTGGGGGSVAGCAAVALGIWMTTGAGCLVKIAIAAVTPKAAASTIMAMAIHGGDRRGGASTRLGRATPVPVGRGDSGSVANAVAAVAGAAAAGGAKLANGS
jgi:hypothetical protein